MNNETPTLNKVGVLGVKAVIKQQLKKRVATPTGLRQPIVSNDLITPTAQNGALFPLTNNKGYANFTLLSGATFIFQSIALVAYFAAAYFVIVVIAAVTGVI